MASHSTYLTATSHQLCAINEITDRSPRLMDEYSLSSLLQLSKASFYLAQFFRPFFNVRIDIASKGAIPTRLDFERRLKRWLVRLYNRGGGGKKWPENCESLDIFLRIKFTKGTGDTRVNVWKQLIELIAIFSVFSRKTRYIWDIFNSFFINLNDVVWKIGKILS